MVAEKQTVAFMLAMFLAAPASWAAGPSCAQVLDEIGTRAQSFHTQAQQMGMGFAVDAALQPSLDAAKKALEPRWNPTLDERQEAEAALRAGQAKLEEWNAKVRRWSSELAGILRCVNDPSCSLTELSGQVNEDLREWLESLGPSEVAERVNKAASLLQDYAARVAGTAMGSASSGVACLSESTPTPQGSSGGTVDLQSSPEPPAGKAAKKSGGKGGKVAVGVIGAGAAVATGVLLGGMAGDLAAMSTGGTCASNRFCIVSVMSYGCECAGSVNGGCGWSGTVVPPGGSCGSGAPCQSGYSCNNGRCEGSNGRCPF